MEESLNLESISKLSIDKVLKDVRLTPPLKLYLRRKCITLTNNCYFIVAVFFQRQRKTALESLKPFSFLKINSNKNFNNISMTEMQLK